jgi:hypothetical protein
MRPVPRQAGFIAALVATFSASALVGAGIAQARVFFESPSGNIGCVLDKREGARCDIREKDWTPPPQPSWCQVDWGYGVQLSRRGRASFLCAGDTAFGGGRSIGYGESIRRGRFQCFSRKTGMRCVNHRNGHGFKLSRQRVRLF